jgi:hypothetical protein
MKRLLVGVSTLLLTVAITAAAGAAKGRGALESADVVNDVTIAFQFSNECNGDKVAVQADLNLVSRIGTSVDGGAHLIAHSHIIGEGVGVPSGAVYRINNFGNDTSNFRSSDGVVSFDVTTVAGVVGVSEGPVDNSLTFTVLHMTVNANGEPTAEVVQTHSECTG